METKEYNAAVPLEEEAKLQSLAQETLQTESSDITAKPSRASAARMRVRRNANFDAAAGLIQQLLLCPALAVCVCTQSRLTLTLEFLAVAVVLAIVNFFFGGFLSEKFRMPITCGSHVLLYSVFAFIHSGIFSGVAVLLVGVLAELALHAADIRIRLCGETQIKTLSERVLAAAVLMLALLGAGTLV